MSAGLARSSLRRYLIGWFDSPLLSKRKKQKNVITLTGHFVTVRCTNCSDILLKNLQAAKKQVAFEVIESENKKIPQETRSTSVRQQVFLNSISLVENR